MSTRRYSEEEIERVFGYFEDGMKTVQISKLLDIPRQTVSHWRHNGISIVIKYIDIHFE